MDTVIVTRKHEWDMAHRLGDGYKSKCRHLHGHRYTAEITVQAPQLDQYGMVMDFAMIKQICGGWIDTYLDHATLVSDTDESLHKLLSVEDQRYYVVPFNTTPENIVRWMAERFQVILPEEITLVKLRIYETPNGWAEWSCNT